MGTPSKPLVKNTIFQKKTRPPKFERFDHRKKMIEIISSFFLNRNSIPSSCLKNQVGNVSELICYRKQKIAFFLTDFSREHPTTFLASVSSLQYLGCSGT